MAFVDESSRKAPDGRLYVVTAAVVAPDDADKARTEMQGLLRRRQRRLHWRIEKPDRREAIIETIGRIGPQSVVYVAQPVAKGKQERARSKCLQKTLWDLAGWGVTEVLIESRGAGDKRDKQSISYARRDGLPSTVRCEFGSPLREPLLWMPDAIAGVTAAHVAGEDSKHFEALPSSLVQVKRFKP